MKLYRAITVYIMAIMSSIPVLAGQNPYQAPQDLTFISTLDGSTQRYVQMLPAGFDPSTTYDIVIALHGHGSDRWQFVNETRDECRATRDIAAANNMIFISPDYRATTSWMGPAAEADMLQLLQSLKQQYKIDEVILTGASMGGSSALTFAALHPQLVDGVSSVNGLADHMTFDNFQTEIAASFGGTKTEVPQEYYNRSAIHFPQSFTMPLAVTAGGEDTAVPAASVRSLYSTVSASNPRTMEFYRSTGGHSTPYVDTAVALEYVIRQAHGIDPQSNPITINRSFESHNLAPAEWTAGVVDGWSVTGTSIGVVNPIDYAYNAEYNQPKPDGDNMVYAKLAMLSQYLGAKIQPGTYTLTLQAGSQLSNTQIATLLAGFATADTNIADVSDLTWCSADSYTIDSELVTGEWTLITLEWTVSADNPAIGKDLYIKLVADSDQFIHLDAISVTFTPEPATMGFLGVGGLGLLRHKRR